MPKGRCPKMKGAICNVQVDVSKTLPPGMHTNGIILFKLKKKLEFKSHVYF